MARLLNQLVGHRETLRPLFEAQAQSRLASTLLFVGPSGIGKKMAALALAQALVCERPGSIEAGADIEKMACGECGGCLRIEKGQSESLMLVEPEGAGIKIEKARDCLQFISLQKLGRARVIVIDQAHLLNPQAGNALLKSLEEPPAGTHFILISHLASAVLPTIRSRSQLVRFKPLGDAEMRKVLGAESDEWVIASAQGSVEAARRLQESRQEYLELEDTAHNFLAVALNRMPVEETSRLKELMKDRGAQAFVSGLLQAVVRDALRLQAGLPLAPGARLPEAAQAGSNFAAPVLRTLADLTLAFEHDLARNVDRGLVLENFAIQWQKAARGQI